MTAYQSLKQRREDVLNTAKRYGAAKLRVFGSVVREDDYAESDIDLLVEMAKGRDLLDLIALEQDLTELLGRRVDVVTDGGLSPYLKDRILAEAVPL